MERRSTFYHVFGIFGGVSTATQPTENRQPAADDQAQASPVRAVLESGSLTETQRQTLLDWQAQLDSLIARRKQMSFRRSSSELETHLRSSIQGALKAIGESCAPLKSALLAVAAGQINQYFGHSGDAREVASSFPALVEFQNFLTGAPAEGSLDALSRQAESTSKLIGRLLEGGEVWKFSKAAEKKP